MSRTTPQMRDLARRVIAYETKVNEVSQGGEPAAFHASERLHSHLAVLMGEGGFRAVLGRALAVASADLPWMRKLQVGSGGKIEGWDRLETDVKENDLTEGGVVLIAQLLGLLVAFIGENLTSHLMREVWPSISLEDLKFTQGDHP